MSIAMKSTWLKLIFATLIMALAPIQSAQAKKVPYLPKGSKLIAMLNTGNYAYSLNHLYVVNITGNSFRKLGQHYGALLKPQIKHQLKEESSKASFKPSGLLTTFVLNTYINNNKLTLHESEFIQGIADSTKLSFNNLLYMNLSFLFSVTDRPKLTNPTLCSFIAKKTAHSIIVGRNLEWTTLFHGDDGQGPIVITTFNLRDNRPHNKVTTIGYLGWYDAATAINDKHLFVEVNSGEGSSRSMNMFSTPNLTSDLVDFMMKDKTLQQLKNDVLHNPTSLAYIANLAGPKEKSSQPFIYSIEKAITPAYTQGKARYTTTSLIRTSSTPTHYSLPIEPDLLVATNTFRVQGWKKYLNDAYPIENPYPSLNEDCARKSFHRYNNLTRLAKQAQTWNSSPDKTMKAIMATPLRADGSGGTTFVGLDPSDTLYTYYSVVFNTNNEILYVNDPVSKHGWTKLNAQALGLR